MTDQELADELALFYTDNPTGTVAEAAEYLDVDEHQVARILDSFVCGQDRTAHHVGAGKGGGWAEVEA